MTLPITVDMTVAESEQQFQMSVSESDISVLLEVLTAVVSSNIPDYEGSYTVTPTSESQTIPTANKRMVHDFVIDPIPSNYGLITYNGSTITVS